ncbi:hypothetical protein FUAX_39500 (plasmid) [Fulvitalea axinellae]|uniref:FAS1 domain-containing protein n=1 Tax=Fulvitalea axinellae TaxID=1182444 RepID=A0AAU9CMN2_9BACT|nr:hypothetical protein FUAX_39500 [Fulvitalea axinellae]
MRLNLHGFKCAIVLFVLILYGCEDNMKHYDISSDLGGRLVTAMEKDAELKQFVKGIDILGMREDLEKSTFTAFPPTDKAILSFMDKEYGVSDISELPEEEVKKIVRGHIIKDAWSWDQLLRAGRYTSKPTDVGYGKSASWDFKFISIYNAPPYEDYDWRTGRVKKLSRQADYLPIFDYDINNGLKEEEDYTFLFPNSQFTGHNVHDAISTRPNQKALNGYYHVIDRVIPPLGNLEMLLANKEEFSLYYSLLRRFGRYVYDSKATEAQKGEVKDSLFYKTYDDWNLDWVPADKNPYNAYSHWYTEMVVNIATIPHNDALQDFLDRTFFQSGAYASIEEIPSEALHAVVANHLQFSRYLTMGWLRPSDLGFFASGGDELVNLEKGDVFYTDFLNNAVVYGLNRTLEPRAYTSVLRKLSMDTTFTYMLRIMNKNPVATNLMNTQSLRSTVFAPNNQVFRDAGIIFNEDANKFQKYNSDKDKYEDLSDSYMQRIFDNHMLFDIDVTDLTSTQYLKTVNETQRIKIEDGKIKSGGVFEIDEELFVTSLASDESGDNGTFYEVSGLLLPASYSVHNYFMTRDGYSEFRKLLEKAGLIKGSSFGLLSSADTYTVLVPSNDVIEANRDLIPEDEDELRKYLSYYIIPDQELYCYGEVDGEFQTKQEITVSSFEQMNARTDTDGLLKFSNLKGTSSAKVIDDVRYSNLLARDGTIHLIDNLLRAK